MERGNWKIDLLLEVVTIIDHRVSPKNRNEMELLVEWSDGEKTWEPWEHLKKLSAVDRYVEEHPEAKLKSLLTGKKS